MNRIRDVLDFLRTNIGELDRQLVGHLLVNRARNADAADFGEAFEAGGDVDAVAEKVAIAFDHVADRDADAKAHVTAGRISEVAGAQAFLDVDRAPHRFYRAGKFGQNRVARGIENAAAIAGDEVVGYLPVRGKTPQRLLFVLGDQSGVTGNVGCEYRRDLAFHDSRPRTSKNGSSMPSDARGRNPLGSRPDVLTSFIDTVATSRGRDFDQRLVHRRRIELVLDALEVVEPLNRMIELGAFLFGELGFHVGNGFRKLRPVEFVERGGDVGQQRETLG